VNKKIITSIALYLLIGSSATAFFAGARDRDYRNGQEDRSRRKVGAALAGAAAVGATAAAVSRRRDRRATHRKSRSERSSKYWQKRKQ